LHTHPSCSGCWPPASSGGRTNMMIRLLGSRLNPHYGTPCSPGTARHDASRRQFLRHGGVGLKRYGGRRSGHRYRRLLPHSGGVLRYCRLQADRAPRAVTGCCRWRRVWIPWDRLHRVSRAAR
jgi:hypothetical protein